MLPGRAAVVDNLRLHDMLVLIPLIRVAVLAVVMVMMPTVPLPLLTPLALILNLASAVLPGPADGLG